MRELLRSPWLTVTLAIVAMSVGYISYVHASGSAAISYECPADKSAEAQHE